MAGSIVLCRGQEPYRGATFNNYPVPIRSQMDPIRTRSKWVKIVKNISGLVMGTLIQ